MVLFVEFFFLIVLVMSFYFMVFVVDSRWFWSMSWSVLCWFIVWVSCVDIDRFGVRLMFVYRLLSWEWDLIIV